MNGPRFFPSGSRFGPCFRSRVEASAASIPVSPLVASRFRTSSADIACHAASLSVFAFVATLMPAPKWSPAATREMRRRLAYSPISDHQAAVTCIALCEGQISITACRNRRSIRLEAEVVAEPHQRLVGEGEQRGVGAGAVLDPRPARRHEGIAPLPGEALPADHRFACAF